MQTVGDYVLTELLGKGTYGEVYKAVNQVCGILLLVYPLIENPSLGRSQAYLQTQPLSASSGQPGGRNWNFKKPLSPKYRPNA